MRTPDISVRAGTVTYPPLRTVERPPEDETSAGPATAEAIAVPVARFPGAPRLAVAAARTAIEASHIPAQDISVNAHAWTNYQGHDLWSPQHYIAHAIGAQHARSSGVYDVCNGGESALELAATRLIMEQEKYGLVTTADIFAEPTFDRFTSDVGIWYGDAGTALALHRAETSGDDTVEMLSARSTSVPRVENMHRTDTFHAYSAGADRSVDVRSTKARYLAAGGGFEFVAAIGGALRAVVLGALQDAGIDPADAAVKHLLLPRIDEATIGKVYLPPLHGVTKATYVRLPDSAFGHLGAGDTPANLVEFAASGRYEKGDIALLVCAGSGFTVSCVCVRTPAPDNQNMKFQVIHDFHPETDLEGQGQ